MKAWTDYPFTELGDRPYVEAPIREVEILSFDRDKYCKVCVSGIVLEVKAGYLYHSPGRCGEVKTVTVQELEALPRYAFQKEGELPCKLVSKGGFAYLVFENEEQCEEAMLLYPEYIRATSFGNFMNALQIL